MQIIVLVVIFKSIVFVQAINQHQYWQRQIKLNYPDVHYYPTKIGKLVKPSISDYHLFHQRLRMLEESSKKEIEELRQRKREIKRRIIEARNNYNSWVIQQQEKMLLEYKKAKDCIFKQDAKIKKMKLVEMKNQFEIWKNQFNQKKKEFIGRFEKEVKALKNEKQQRSDLISQILNEREQLNYLLKKNERHFY